MITLGKYTYWQRFLSVLVSCVALLSLNAPAYASNLERTTYTPEEYQQILETNQKVDDFFSSKALARGGAVQLPIEAIKQPDDNSCGAVACLLISNYWNLKYRNGLPYTLQNWQTELGITSAGTSSDIIANKLNVAFGATTYQKTNTKISDLYSSIVYSLDQGYPVVVNIKKLPDYSGPVVSGHFIVATGYKYAYSTPLGGMDTVTYKDSNPKYFTDKNRGTFTITGLEMVEACNSNKGNFVRSCK